MISILFDARKNDGRVTVGPREEAVQTEGVTQMIEEGFLAEADAAQRLGLKASTLRNWAAQRKGPPRIVVGRKVFYRREALLDWMKSQERTHDASRADGRRAKKRAA